MLIVIDLMYMCIIDNEKRSWACTIIFLSVKQFTILNNKPLGFSSYAFLTILGTLLHAVSLLLNIQHCILNKFKVIRFVRFFHPIFCDSM